MRGSSINGRQERMQFCTMTLPLHKTAKVLIRKREFICCNEITPKIAPIRLLHRQCLLHRQFVMSMLKLQRLAHFFSSSLDVPIVDLSGFLSGTAHTAQDCNAVAKALTTYGCLIIKDPRVKAQENSLFLDLMENFFDRRSKEFYAGRPVPDIFPEQGYRIGATPENVEKAREQPQVIKTYSASHRPQTPQPPPFDAKWRYIYIVGGSTEDNALNRIPQDFPEFKQTVEAWGTHMVEGCNTVAEMAAIGLGLQRNAFSELMKGSPRLVAPTGSDLTRYKVGTVFAAFHYDLNLLTIHGKSRYPGLFAWLRTGQRFSVSLPQGHLLLQAGKQLEWLTGGHIRCGYHEVIYTPEVEARRNEAIKEGKIPWRVSSTLFSQTRKDVVLQPLGRFANPESQKKYPAVLAKKFVEQELASIGFSRS